MLNVVLYQPEIPPNTGNVIRLCANTGSRLHLVGPLGFTLDDARLRRAGLDYHEWATVRSYDDWSSYLEQNGKGRLWAFSTRGSHHYCEAGFRAGDTLLFGPETRVNFFFQFGGFVGDALFKRFRPQDRGGANTNN